MFLTDQGFDPRVSALLLEISRSKRFEDGNHPSTIGLDLPFLGVGWFVEPEQKEDKRKKSGGKILKPLSIRSGLIAASAPNTAICQRTRRGKSRPIVEGGLAPESIETT